MAMVTIQEKLIRKKQQWQAANDALDALLAAPPVEQYSFSDPNGTQSARRRRIADYQELIGTFEAEIEELEQKLQGGGIMTVGTQRY